jgi:hypothetical protein
MRIGQSCDYPIPLKKGWDYLTDWHLFPTWRVAMFEILEPETATWNKAGDSIRFAYKLLGRRIEGVATIDEYKEGELIRLTANVPGLPLVHEEWHYEALDDNKFLLKVVQDTEPTESFFGKVIDKMLMPRALQKDLERTLENLIDIFAMGVED